MVGGCVRDYLLGREPKDYDIVLDAADLAFTELNCIKQAVGESFLVYLAKTPTGRSVEIALPRKETKVGTGHRGFVTARASDIKEDLIRRDFTMNSIAYDYSNDSFICGHPDAIEHVRSGVLQHTSEAFVEDPLRVFRGARFLATIPLVIRPETQALFSTMKEEVQTLSADRVRVELEKAMIGEFPWKFFRLLRNADLLGFWFPEVSAMVGLEHRHEEGDVFVHTMMVMEKLCSILEKKELTSSLRFEMMLCALSHDFGKPCVPEEIRPKMHGHEDLAEWPVFNFCERLRLCRYERSMQIVAKYHMTGHRASLARAGTLYKLMSQVERTRIGFQGFVDLCHADATGRISTKKDVCAEWEHESSILQAAYKAEAEAVWPEDARWEVIQDSKIKSIKAAIGNIKRSLAIKS